MSKKMMKRSLVLGALMAFVITGSAWAAEVELNGAYITDVVNNIKGKPGDTVIVNDGVIIQGEQDYDGDYNGKSASLHGGHSEDDKVTSSGVKINGGKVGGEIVGGHSQSQNAYNNFVTITSGEVYGPYSYNSDYGEEDKQPGSVVGGYGGISANENKVSVSGGTVIANVYGGKSNGIANNNIVDVSSGEVKRGFFILNGEIDDTYDVNIYGGYSGGEYAYSTDGLEANNNTVNISGTAIVNEVNLYGGYVYGVSEYNGTGNTLNIGEGWKGSIGSVQNFNIVNFGKGSSVTTNVTLGSGATINLADGDAYIGDGIWAIDGTLTVNSDEATLTIGNIKAATYNIASAYKGTAEWKIENTLMEGEWTTDNGLQVQIQAKKAEDIAEDMGVSVNIANTMTDIITAANNSEAPKTEAAQNVIDFANALADAAPEVAGQAVEAVVKMAEEVGQSAIAASIVKNVTDITNDRLSFNCGHSAPQKGGHGVGLLEEGSGADVWVEYVHGKDEVENMKSTAGATSYEGQYNGFVMGVDFKKVNKFQSGIAFNYGEGDTNSVGSLTRTHSDYDFWGVGYYGNIHNDDSNVIFDINYAKTDSDVTQKNFTGDIEASPEATTWTAGVKVEKLYQNENVRIVPYTGLRYMSIDADDYSTKCGTYNYKMERKDIWLLPVGVSIKQEVANDNGWTVSPRVDLSYIWAFGDTDSNMEFATALNTKTNIGYDVMDDGSFLGLVGIEAHKGQWGYGVSYSYQKGDHSESKKWYVDVNYSF